MTEATMATFQNTLTIQRPVADVFAFLADFENIPTWNYAIVETRKTSPGPVGVGTTYRQLRSIPDRREEGFEVTVFEPTTRLEVHGEIGPFTATIRYLLAPVGDGTQLINVVDLESASGVVRLLAPLATSRVKAAVAANLNTLKKTLEASGQSVPG
jgi:Polyketide cyclase / dehydrase and lipid transport